MTTNLNYDYIKENIEAVRKKIESAALRAGRNPQEIQLIAVSKNVGCDRIKEAFRCGITDFGENRVQELCEKYDILNEDYNWHMIGHLQTNKVKYIIDKVRLIHSLDSLELAREIQKRAEKADKTVNVLVQVNIAEEESKFGISRDEALKFVKEVSRMENIKVKGLMTIAPFTSEPESIRWVFSDLRKLLIDIRQENIDNIDMECLSMGMSNDFEVAIEEGSNMVRIGTALFGKR